MKRHDLVWLDKKYCSSNEFLQNTFTNKDIVAAWIENNHPFIVTRQLDTTNKYTSLGFLLPLDEGKKRVAINVDTNAISKHTNPVKLSQVLPKVEKKWYEPLTELVDSFSFYELELYIFGSSMWEYIIEKKYMTDSSDIDLLWKPTNFYQFEKGLEILKKWMEKYPLKIDGEVEFLCQSACSWKELLNDDEYVIIKRIDKVSMESKTEFIDSLKGN